MEPTKHILLFGAGKSATALIDYLKQTAARKNWQVTVADVDGLLAQSKTGDHEWVKAARVTVENEKERQALIETADLVISLLPVALHYLVAVDCLAFGKHLLTASYLDKDIRVLAKDIAKKDVLFLCEMGLDPGIDHMSAMQLIHRIKNEGGCITSFVSHCGGLVAPESDDNPWHYKISWNPRNVVLAGKAGAVYKENAETKNQKYETLFADCEGVNMEGLGQLVFYPNRDSLSYVTTYELDQVTTFKRTTLRHPDFCRGWKMVVDLGLTDEKNNYETDSLSISSFLKLHFTKKNIPIALDGGLLSEQFAYLGLEDLTFINKGQCSSADVLQWILEKKWALKETDKDLVVMQHEIVYEGKDKTVTTLTSSLIVEGEDQQHTAMAKTVGLPLGIAACLLLEGKISERGLHIPILPGIYEPVLKELAEQGVVFREKISNTG